MEVRFDNYRITSDRYNYMFQEFKGVTLDKKGKEKEKCDTWGYYGSLPALVRSLPDAVMRRSNGNLKEAVGEAGVFVARLAQALASAGVAV